MFCFVLLRDPHGPRAAGLQATPTLSCFPPNINMPSFARGDLQFPAEVEGQGEEVQPGAEHPRLASALLCLPSGGAVMNGCVDNLSCCHFCTQI